MILGHFWHMLGSIFEQLLGELAEFLVPLGTQRICHPGSLEVLGACWGLVDIQNSILIDS